MVLEGNRVDLNIHFTFASLTTGLEFNGVIFGDICYRGGILIRPQNFLWFSKFQLNSL